MTSYAFGEKLRFVAGARGAGFLGSGWSTPEARHCWSTGQRAEIVLPLADLPAGDMLLRLRCQGFRPRPEVRCQSAVVTVNGHTVDALEAREPGWHDIRVPRGLVTRPEIIVGFSFLHPSSPASHGLSSDTRDLAISLDALVVFDRPDPGAPGIHMIGAGADPVGDVFVSGGSYHRAIRRASGGTFEALRRDGLYDLLADKGLIPEHAFSPLAEGEYASIASSVTGQFVYPPKYPWLMFRDAAHAWLEINRVLFDASGGSLGLCDGHYGNFIQCENARPKWCDIGSIVSGDSALEFGFAEFVRCYMLPLALATLPLREGFNIRQMMVHNTNGVPIQAAIAEHGEALADIALDEHYATGGRREALDAMQAILDSFDLKAQQGFWSDYRNAGALESAWRGDLVKPGHDTRFAEIVALAKSCDVDSFIDIGCNDGIFSLLCGREGMRGLGIDLDEDSINKMYAFAKDHPATELAISYGGFMDVEGRHPLVLLLALTHHLVLSQKLTFAQVASKLAAVSSAHVITEFMPDGLGGTPANPRPFPDPLPAEYTLDGFLSALRVEFKDVRVVEYERRADPAHMSRRILVHCHGPRGGAAAP